MRRGVVSVAELRQGGFDRLHPLGEIQVIELRHADLTGGKTHRAARKSQEAHGEKQAGISTKSSRPPSPLHDGTTRAPESRTSAVGCGALRWPSRGHDVVSQWPHPLCML